jgi:hypothetical protein
MAKFSVDVKEVWEYTIEVELPADATKEQILAAANRKIGDGDQGNDMEYSHTLAPEQWSVRDEKGNYLRND